MGSLPERRSKVCRRPCSGQRPTVWPPANRGATALSRWSSRERVEYLAHRFTSPVESPKSSNTSGTSNLSKPDGTLVIHTPAIETSTPSLVNYSRTYDVAGATLPPCVMTNGILPTPPMGSGTSFDPMANGQAMPQPIAYAPTFNSDHENDFTTRIWEDIERKFRELRWSSEGRSRTYQKPYPFIYDSVPYPAGWHVSDFIKFDGESPRTTWEHISQYLAQLGEACFIENLRIHLGSVW